MSSEQEQKQLASNPKYKEVKSLLDEDFKERKLKENEIIKANSQVLYFNHLNANVSSPDIVDQASSYTEKNVEMRTVNRQIKLVSKIDSALKRIEDGTYGYCKETGEPIGLKRLIARPIATLSIAAQEKHEKEEKIYADL